MTKLVRSAAVVTVGMLVICALTVELTAAPVTREEFEAKLGYQTGIIALPGGMATINVPETFRYIGHDSARRLLTNAWGNPPEASENVLGMLIPANVSPLAKEGWGIVISFDDHGYVDDKDAATMDYGKLLKQMQDETREANVERQKEGFEPIQVIGWAEPPSYDAAAHKLYWAKELAFGTTPQHTLNYGIRILGRRGVLVLNAVAGMSQLPLIRAETQSVLGAINFGQGHRYQDYLPGKDKAATYGIAGLILGATAAKAGLFKVLWVGLLAFKKLILAGLVAAGAALKKLFGGGKSSEPQQPQQPNTSPSA
jgi:uncharacterized membrane-anchored protein